MKIHDILYELKTTFYQALNSTEKKPVVAIKKKDNFLYPFRLAYQMHIISFTLLYTIPGQDHCKKKSYIHFVKHHKNCYERRARCVPWPTILKRLTYRSVSHANGPLKLHSIEDVVLLLGSSTHPKKKIHKNYKKEENIYVFAEHNHKKNC